MGVIVASLGAFSARVIIATSLSCAQNLHLHGQTKFPLLLGILWKIRYYILHSQFWQNCIPCAEWPWKPWSHTLRYSSKTGRRDDPAISQDLAGHEAGSCKTKGTSNSRKLIGNWSCQTLLTSWHSVKLSGRGSRQSMIPHKSSSWCLNIVSAPGLPWTWIHSSWLGCPLWFWVTQWSNFWILHL